jgi:hypothetical protein
LGIIVNLLDTLTEAQKEALISLPYRAGLWVSLSDSAGGEDAGYQERQALESILSGFAAEMFGSELVQQVMTQAIAARERWPAWAGNLSTVEEDCRFAVDFLARRGESKDLNAFRNHLLEIAQAVAQAHSEYGQASAWDKMRHYGTYFAGRVGMKAGGGRTRTLNEYLSVSAGERKALRALAKALGTTYT